MYICIENYSERGHSKKCHHWNYLQASESQVQGLSHFNQNDARTMMYHLKKRPCIESAQI